MPMCFLEDGVCWLKTAGRPIKKTEYTRIPL